ncbi:MAG: CrcB family protein [Pseudolysinimonas sp.]
MLAVLVGGLIGTGLRLGIDALLPHAPSDFPVSTLLINIVGSFALGALVARVWPQAPDWLRFGLGTGVLGSFTTFSAVMVSLVSMMQAPLLDLAYLAASLVGGLGAAALGLRLGRFASAPSSGAQITSDE